MTKTTKTFIIIGLLIFIALAAKFLTPEDSWICRDGQWIKHGNPTSAAPIGGCDDGTPVTQYSDPTNSWSISVPDSWRGKYDIQQLEDEVSKSTMTVYSYLAEDKSKQLLFIINSRTSAEDNVIYAEPNAQIIAITPTKVYSVSQALDMPFAPQTADYDTYSAMMSKLEAVIGSFVSSEQYYVKVKQNIDFSEADKYIINAQYPQVVGYDNTAEINELISQQIDDRIAAFQDSLVEWNRMDSGFTSPSSYIINPSVVRLDDKYISLYFTVSESLSGSAHPNNYSLSFNYDADLRKQLMLTDLFIAKQELYLAKLTELSLVGLQAEFEARGMDKDSDMVKEGTEPKLENYDNFNITVDGLRFNFDPYQIGPYAAGNFVVNIDFMQLEGMIDNKFINSK